MKTLFAILFSFLSIHSIAQCGRDTANTDGHLRYNKGITAFKEELIIPQDTLTSTCWGASSAIAIKGGLFYYNSGSKWTAITGGGGGSGTIIAQSPLIATTIGSTTTVSIPAATGSVSGYLATGDWNTFNNKQNALGYTAENVGNKVTNLNTANNTQYPSALTVLAALNAVYAKAQADSIALADSINTKEHPLTANNGVVRIGNNLSLDYTNAGTFTNAFWHGAAIADAYIASSGNWNTAYNGFPVSGSFSAGTLTLNKNGGGSFTVTGFNTGTVTGITFTGPLTGGTITGSGTVSMPVATGSISGYLSALDWNTFNNKQAAGSYLTTSLTNGQILVGNGSGIATAVTPSGQLSMSNAGLFSIGTGTVTSSNIQDGAIVNADVNTSAAIAYSKLNLAGSVSTADLSATGTANSTNALYGNNTWADPLGKPMAAYATNTGSVTATDNVVQAIGKIVYSTTFIACKNVSVSVTGTASEIALDTLLIPGGSLGANDKLVLTAQLASAASPTGNKTFRFYIGSSQAFASDTLMGSQLLTTSNLALGYVRHYVNQNSVSINDAFPTSATGNPTDDIGTNTAYTVINMNYAINKYLIVTCQLSNVGDRGILKNIQLRVERAQ